MSFCVEAFVLYMCGVGVLELFPNVCVVSMHIYIYLCVCVCVCYVVVWCMYVMYVCDLCMCSTYIHHKQA